VKDKRRDSIPKGQNLPSNPGGVMRNFNFPKAFASNIDPLLQIRGEEK